jgi:Protein of unknown function (DUF1552)
VKFMSRRNLLRGAGVCLALPFLPSLTPRHLRAQATTPTKRFILCSFPNGAATHWWETVPAFGTTSRGNAFVLPRVLEAFTPLKSKLLMISHLGNYTWRDDQAANQDPGIEPAHSRCMAALTTCVDADQKARDAGLRDLGTAAVNSTSVDQLIAQLSAGASGAAKPSLQTGLGVKPGFFDYRSSAYNQAVSWKSPQEPLMRSVNPKAVFDALIQAGASSGASTEQPSDGLARAAIEKSVLDVVREDAKSLLPRLGSSDRQVLEQYLEGVQSIEKEVTRVGATMTDAASCSVISEPGVVPEPPGPQQGLTQGDNGYDHEAHADVMNDLIVMALQCDVTRVITHMLDDARSEFEYRNIPAAVRAQVDLEYREGSSLHYHGSQHGSGNLERAVENGRYKVVESSNKDFAAITAWMAGKVASLAGRLDAIPDGDGSLLDHSVLVFGSEMRTHDHDGFDLPLLLLGGDGHLLSDAHVAYDSLGNDRQMRDFWFTLLRQYYQVDINEFGDDKRGVPNALLEEILA